MARQQVFLGNHLHKRTMEMELQKGRQETTSHRVMNSNVNLQFDGAMLPSRSKCRQWRRATRMGSGSRVEVM